MKQQAVLENFKEKEEEKKADDSTPPNPVVGLTSLVESIQRKQITFHSIAGGVPGLASYLQDVRIL